MRVSRTERTMARACAARYRKQARGACQAAATALAVGLRAWRSCRCSCRCSPAPQQSSPASVRRLGRSEPAQRRRWASARGRSSAAWRCRGPAGRKAWAGGAAWGAGAAARGGRPRRRGPLDSARAAAWKNTAAPTLAGAGAVVLAGAAVKVRWRGVGALPFAVLAAAAAFALGEPPETAAALGGGRRVGRSAAAALVRGARRCRRRRCPRARRPPSACAASCCGASHWLASTARRGASSWRRRRSARVPGAARRWRGLPIAAAHVDAGVAPPAWRPSPSSCSARSTSRPPRRGGTRARCPRPLVASRTGPTRTSSRDGASAARRTAQTTASSKRCGTRRAPPDTLIAPARSGTSTRCDGPWASRSARRCRATRCIDSPTCWASSSCSCTTRGRPATAAPGRVAGAPWSRWTAPAKSFTPSGPD